MASANNDRLTMGYISDDGVTYKITTSANHISALGAEGFVPATDDMPTFPKGWKPRTVHGFIKNETGRDKRITIVVPKREQFATLTSIEVPPYGTFAVTGRTGERRTIPAPLWDGIVAIPDKPYKQRVQILYKDDKGNDWLMTTTRERALAVNAAAVVLSGTGKQLPRTIRPRHYNLIEPSLAGTDKKLVLVEPDPAAAFWTTDNPSSITVGETPYRVTGRKAESNHRSAPIAVE
jgi:hypothetical protein